jgi:hypothetical protein
VVTALLAAAVVGAGVLGVARAADLAGGSGGAARVSAHLSSPGTWTLLPTPDPSVLADQLASVSCASLSFCMAVGQQQGTTGGSALITEWDGAGWTLVPAPVPALPTRSLVPIAPDDLLDGVSCPATAFCMAVGAQPGGGGTETLAEEWNGTSWSIVASPSPATSSSKPSQPVSPVSPVAPPVPPVPPASPVSPVSPPVPAGGSGTAAKSSPLRSQPFNAVSCTGPTFCMAVGDVKAASGSQALAEQWNGTTWSIVATPSGTPAEPQVLEGIDCPATSFCVADGLAQTPDGNTVPLLEEWNGTAWSLMAPAGTESGGELLGVSCWGPAFCMADGYVKAPTGIAALMEEWNGTAWSVVPVPPATTSDGSGLAGLSCVGPSLCVATGVDLTGLKGATGTPAALEWNGQSWQQGDPVSTGPAADLALLYSVSCVARQFCMAVGVDQNNTTGAAATLAEQAPLTSPGYQAVSADGGVFALGGSFFAGSARGLALAAPVVGMATTPDAGGYWLVAADGGVFAFGDAAFFGSTGALRLNRPIVGMAATPDGRGYWLVAADGGVFAFGDAGFHGSAAGVRLAGEVVGMAATPDGGGYWLVAADGGVFTGGDAPFYGSAAGVRLSAPIVGITATPDGKGYWLVGADGGVFTGGDATFSGSAGGLSPSAPVVGLAG